MLARLLKVLGVPEGTAVTYAPVPARTTPSLAHEALLVCLNPVNGKVWDHTRHIWDSALLVELAHEGRLEVTGFGRKTRYAVHDASPLGDPDLDKALLRLENPWPSNKVMSNVFVLPRHEDLLGRLVEKGLLVEGEHKTLGLFRSRRFHATPAAGREKVAARVRSVLLGERVPDERTALLVAALAVGLPSKFLVPKDRVKEANRRKAEIHAGIGEREQALISAVQAARDRAEGGGGDTGGGGGD